MAQQRMSQAERTELSDRRMVEAAITLIVEHGAEKTTLKDVGELAGYSRSLAGYRFGNKAGLFEFVIRSIGEDWLHEMKRSTEGLVGYQAIEAATDAHYRMCVEAPNHVAAFYILWFGAIGSLSEVKPVISTIHERRHKDVALWIIRGVDQGSVSRSVDADAVAGLFSTSIVGIIYQWLVNPDDLDSLKSLYDNLKQTMKLWLSNE